jgi:hypothetical protein
MRLIYAFLLSCGALNALDVTNRDDEGQGSLREALLNVTPDDNVINIDADLVGAPIVIGTMTNRALPLLTGVTINGNGNAISGNGKFPIFFAYSGDNTLNDLVLEKGLGQGGDGGDGAGGGGGAMGAGGALFISPGLAVEISNVTFEGNQVIGGNGGNGSTAILLGGGGGGGGYNSKGGDAQNSNGTGGSGGGGGGVFNSPGGIGDTSGGGGGGLYASAGGNGILVGGGGGGGGVFGSNGGDSGNSSSGGGGGLNDAAGGSGNNGTGGAGGGGNGTDGSSPSGSTGGDGGGAGGDGQKVSTPPTIGADATDPLHGGGGGGGSATNRDAAMGGDATIGGGGGGGYTLLAGTGGNGGNNLGQGGGGGGGYTAASAANQGGKGGDAIFGGGGGGGQHLDGGGAAPGGSGGSATLFGGGGGGSRKGNSNTGTFSAAGNGGLGGGGGGGSNGANPGSSIFGGGSGGAKGVAGGGGSAYGGAVFIANGSTLMVTNGNAANDIAWPAGSGSTQGLAAGSGFYLMDEGSSTLTFNISSGVTSIISDTLAGQGTITKTGQGTLMLTGSNAPFSGQTVINQGILLLEGSLTDQVLVAITGQLSGNGTVNGTLQNSSIVAPGDPFGKLTVNGSFTQNSNSYLIINALNAANWGELAVQGAAAVSGTLILNLVPGERFTDGEQIVVLDTTGGISGSFQFVKQNFPPYMDATPSSDNRIVITFSVNLAPPAYLRGRQRSNVFATQAESVNRLTWSASTSPETAAYAIYRNGTKIANLSAKCPLVFNDHNQPRGKPQTYQVRSVDNLGNQGPAATVAIP